MHEGRWLPGTLLAARKGEDGRWLGLVTYTDTQSALSVPLAA
jgi:hypothetical protein